MKRHDTGNNPALNQEAFNRVVARLGAAERVDMTARGAYLKTGFQLVLWLVVEIEGHWPWQHER